MKNCISVVNIQNNGKNSKMYNQCIDSLKRYAQKYSIDLIQFQEYKIKTNSVVFEKFQNLELFKQGYDRILQIDADVLVSPQAENIFDVYNDPSKFYAFQENYQLPGLERNSVVESFSKDFVWPKMFNGLYCYFNAGIYLCSRNHYEALKDWRKILDKIGDTPFCEQDILNYIVFSNKILFESFDHSWNRMDLGMADPNNDRRKGNFIHYAGRGYSFFESKESIIDNDYKYFYTNL